MKLFIDASTHPNTHESGVGLVVYQNKKSTCFSIPLLCHYNNHEAEFIALIIAFNYLKENNVTESISIYSDSQTVVQAMNEHKLKDSALKELHYIASQRQQSLPQLFIEWIPEKRNKKADELARLARQAKERQHFLNIDHF